MGEEQPVIQTTSCTCFHFACSLFVPLASANGEAGSSFGAAAKEHKRLFYNDASFLLAMAIADGALFGYDSLDDITPTGNSRE